MSLPIQKCLPPGAAFRRLASWLGCGLALGWAALAAAGEVRGRVLDEASGEAIANWAQVEFYRYNSGSKGWDWYTYAGAGLGKADFSATLPAGRYRLYNWAVDYLEEWYDDQVPRTPGELTLDEGGVLELNPILLTPAPLHRFYVRTTAVQQGGGGWRFSLDIHNNTGKSAALKVWAVLRASACGAEKDDYCYYNYRYDALAEVGRVERLTVPANNKSSLRYQVVLPEDLPDGQHTLIINVGRERWKPVSQSAWTYFSSGPAISLTPAAHAPGNAPAIPAHIDADGRPQGWLRR